MNTEFPADRKWNQRGSEDAAAAGEVDRLLRLLFERSPDPIWLFDPVSGVFIDCNAAAVNLMRAGTKERLLRTTPTDLAPPFQADGRASAVVSEEIRAKVAQHGTWRFEWLARRFDGTEFPAEVTVTPLDSDGRRIDVVVSRDISERKRTLADLRASEQLLAGIAENITEGIYRTSPQHELIFANPAYLQMFGYRLLEEIQQVPRVQLYARAEDRARLLELLDRHGGFRNAEVEFVRRDGSHFWGLMSSSAIRDALSGAVAYHVGSVTDITERKRAEDEIRRLNQSLERRVAERTAELRASEERLRTLVEHAPEAIIVFDGDTGRFLSANENACRLYGLSHDELTRLTPAEVSPPRQPDGRPSAEAARSVIQRALDGEAPVFEWLHRHASGREFFCEVRLIRLPGEGRKLVRASITDQTERRRRDLIQRAVYRISEMVHAAPDLPGLYAGIHAIVRELMPAENFYIAIFDPRSQTLSFDYHVDEATPHPDPLPLNTGLTSYVLRNGRTLRVGREMNDRKRRVGDAVTFEGYEGISYIESGVPAAIWLGVPLLIQGQPIGVMAVQDYHNDSAYGPEEENMLTFVAGQIALAIERKRSEQALRESEAKHRALFEASSQGVMLQDEEKFLEVNPAAVRILGFTGPEEVIGKHPAQTSAPFQPDGEDSATAARRHIAECMEKGSARFDWLSRTARGEEVPIEVILTRIPMGGRPIIQAMIHDISERKRAEAELLKTLAREKELNRLKSNFVSMVSHEFRTPLGVIQSSAEILADYFDRLEAAERQEHLQSIQKNTRRMAELMEEVLVLSRFEAGRMDFEPAVLDLTRFCQQLTDELLSVTHRRCPLLLTTSSLPSEAKIDERLLRHILTNLVTNAVKYSPPESAVELTVSRHEDEAIFVVRDHGIGIPGEDQPWLFNAFQRGRNVGDRPGTGLGLVIVKRCVDLHRGRIKVESDVGRGTTVTVRLPAF